MLTNSRIGASPARSHTIAVIPGDGIGKEVMPEGLRVLEAAASRFDIDLQFKHIDWASCDYYEEHGTMMPDDWKAQLGRLRRHLLRRRGLAAESARPHLVVGLAAQVPPRVRPVHQPAAGAAVRGRALPARGPQARRHRFLRGARKHRRRVHQPGRPRLRRHRPRVRDPGIRVHTRGDGAGDALCLRPGPNPQAQARHGGDQEQRRGDQHALVG